MNYVHKQFNYEVHLVDLRKTVVQFASIHKHVHAGVTYMHINKALFVCYRLCGPHQWKVLCRSQCVYQSAAEGLNKNIIP